MSLAQIAFIQPFGVEYDGGGPKVLRGLLRNAPMHAISINVAVVSEGATSTRVPEIHIAPRPSFGRLEKTRLRRHLEASSHFFRNQFRRKLRRCLIDQNISVVHAIAHSWDCLDAYAVARSLGLRFVLTVHDDLLYILQGQPRLGLAGQRLAEMWRGADLRIVISDEMGREYCRRYGEQTYLLVTDGLESVETQPRSRMPKHLRVYFMGLLHQSYLPNFAELVTALDEIAVECPDWEISLTARCGSAGRICKPSRIKLRELPFVAKNPTVDDMTAADVCYLPLPFTKDHRAFIRFSLSTKMVGYLGSGLPILYHGPAEAAACKTLESFGAAQCATTPNSASLKEALYALLERYEPLALAGLSLARERFLYDDNFRRFWDGVLSVSGIAESER